MSKITNAFLEDGTVQGLVVATATILLSVVLVVVFIAIHRHGRRRIVRELKDHLNDNITDRVCRRLAAQVAATRAVFQEVYGTPPSKIISDIGISQTFLYEADDMRQWTPERYQWIDGLCIAKGFAQRASDEILPRTEEGRGRIAKRLATFQNDRDLNWLASYVSEIAWDYFGERALLHVSVQSNAEKLLMLIWRYDLSAWLFSRKVRAELDRKDQADVPLKVCQPSLFDASYRVQSLYAKLADLIDAHRDVIEVLADEIVRSTPKIDSQGDKFFVTYSAPVATLHRLMQEHELSTRPATPPPQEAPTAP